MYNCWICKDKGFIIVTTIKEGYKYDYPLHCNCSMGNREKIDYTTDKGTHYFTEPISKYYDVKQLESKNRASYIKGGIDKNMIKKEVDVLYQKLY
jgi:hypothetical protein